MAAAVDHRGGNSRWEEDGEKGNARPIERPFRTNEGAIEQKDCGLRHPNANADAPLPSSYALPLHYVDRPSFTDTNDAAFSGTAFARVELTKIGEAGC